MFYEHNWFETHQAFYGNMKNADVSDSLPMFYKTHLCGGCGSYDKDPAVYFFSHWRACLTASDVFYHFQAIIAYLP